MYDQDGDGVLGSEEIFNLVAKIAKTELPAMNMKQLENAVAQTVMELDEKKKDGLSFKEFEKIFQKRL